jgi:hypothetical protein
MYKLNVTTHKRFLIAYYLPLQEHSLYLISFVIFLHICFLIYSKQNLVACIPMSADSCKQIVRIFANKDLFKNLFCEFLYSASFILLLHSYFFQYMVYAYSLRSNAATFHAVGVQDFTFIFYVKTWN